MKKKVFLGIFILCIGLIIFVYKVTKGGSVDEELLVKANSIENKSFLENKLAVLYYSTTADQDFDNKGIGYAIFIDDDGLASAYKMNGLELGTIAKTDHSLLLADKDSIRIIGKTYKEFKQDKPQYTGERTGFLKDTQLYFSVYNTGVNNQTGTYDSNVLFGDETGFTKGNIPYYILTSGMTDSQVPILTLDVEKNIYDLREVSFANDEVNVKDMVRLENKENAEFANLSPIVSDADFYYVVLSQFIDEKSEKVVLFKINKTTFEQEQITVAEYRNNDNLVATIPFSVPNSAYIYKDSLYYIDGLGDVYVLNKDSNEMNLKFTIKNHPTDGVRHGEGTYFQDGNVYLLRYDEKGKDKYSIEKYSLTTGEREKVIPIRNLNDLLTSIKGKSIHSYDFKMLK